MTKTLQEIRSSSTFWLRKEPPTFVEGVSSILEVDTNVTEKYKATETEEQADFMAMSADWEAVGKDMYFALDEYGKQRT